MAKSYVFCSPAESESAARLVLLERENFAGMQTPDGIDLDSGFLNVIHARPVLPAGSYPDACHSDP